MVDQASYTSSKEAPVCHPNTYTYMYMYMYKCTSTCMDSFTHMCIFMTVLHTCTFTGTCISYVYDAIMVFPFLCTTLLLTLGDTPSLLSRNCYKGCTE